MHFNLENGERAKAGQDYDAAFGAVLLAPDRPKPGGVVGPHGKAAEKRFNVYRNNVTYSLVTALSEIFPTVTQILGEQNFRMLARDFLRAHPPRSRLVFEYGHAFADFLAGFEPLRHLAYLPDVARLERAWLDAYHAADAPPLAAADIGAVPPETLARLRFTIHPATRLVGSGYAIHSIVTAHRFGPMPERIDAGRAESVLVTRPKLQVTLRLLSPGQFSFFEALRDGKTLQEAAEQAADKDTAFDLAQAIGILIDSGAFTGCVAAATNED